MSSGDKKLATRGQRSQRSCLRQTRESTVSEKGVGGEVYDCWDGGLAPTRYAEETDEEKTRDIKTDRWRVRNDDIGSPSNSKKQDDCYSAMCRRQCQGCRRSVHVARLGGGPLIILGVGCPLDGDSAQDRGST